jgi:hypothetical protein
VHSSVHQTDNLLFVTLLQLIVLNIGFDLGFIPQNMLTMLVIMAVVTTMMTRPLLRALLPKAGYVIPVGVEA